MCSRDLRCPDTSLRHCGISRRSVFQDCSRFGSKSVTNHCIFRHTPKSGPALKENPAFGRGLYFSFADRDQGSAQKEGDLFCPKRKFCVLVDGRQKFRPKKKYRARGSFLFHDPKHLDLSLSIDLNLCCSVTFPKPIL